MDTLREDCCVCLRRTRRRTPCQHPLCRHCFKRLRRRECPYCRSELVMTVQEIQRRPTPLSPEDLELLRNCDSLDQLHEVALTLSGKMPTSSPSDRRNVMAAVAKRCCCTSDVWPRGGRLARAFAKPAVCHRRRLAAALLPSGPAFAAGVGVWTAPGVSFVGPKQSSGLALLAAEAGTSGHLRGLPTHHGWRQLCRQLASGRPAPVWTRRVGRTP